MLLSVCLVCQYVCQYGENHVMGPYGPMDVHAHTYTYEDTRTHEGLCIPTSSQCVQALFSQTWQPPQDTHRVLEHESMIRRRYWQQNNQAYVQ